MAPSTAAHFWLRVPSSESIAPALIRLSIMRRLTRAQVHLLAELVQRREAAHLLARLADGLHRGLPQVLDRAQAEADGLAVGREAPLAVVHVRRQNP